MEKLKIYHVETQEDYDDLMIKLEEQGYRWLTGEKLSSANGWIGSEEETSIYLNKYKDYTVTHGFISTARENNPDIPIIKHKAKGVEQMEKVVVPKFVADWFKEVKGDKRTLYNTLSALKHSENVEVCDWYKGDDTLDIHENLYKKQQIIAKMHLYGYEVEEKKYYWKRKSEHSLKVEEPDAVYLNYYVDRGTVFFGSIINGKMVKTKLTEKEVLSLVGEEDFNKLEKVEIEDV